MTHQRCENCWCVFCLIMISYHKSLPIIKSIKLKPVALLSQSVLKKGMFLSALSWLLPNKNSPTCG